MAYISTSSAEFSEDPDKMREMMEAALGPQAVDHQIRQAISLCWAMLPKERRTVEAVEAEIHRLVDRALANLKEDGRAFGILPEA
jgi:hypothetical protein